MALGLSHTRETPDAYLAADITDQGTPATQTSRLNHRRNSATPGAGTWPTVTPSRHPRVAVWLWGPGRHSGQ